MTDRYPNPTSVSVRQKKIDEQNQLAWTLQDVEPQRALALSQETYRWSAQGEVRYLKGIAFSLRNLGAIHYNLGDYQAALSHLFESLTLFETDLGEFNQEQTSVLRTIGLTYLRLANHPLALEYQMKALHLSETADDSTGLARALNNIAAIHHWSGDYPQALARYQEARQLNQHVNDKALETILLGNMADIYSTLGQYERAREHGYKGLHHARALGNRIFEANIVGTMGQIALLMGEMESALTHFQTLLALSIEIGERHLEVGALRHIGKVYNQRGQQCSIDYLEQALDLAQEIDAKSEVFECYKELAYAYKERHDFARALFYYELFHQAEKEVFSNESAQKLKNLQVVYETEATRKEAELYQLKNVTLEQEIVRRQESETALRQSKEQAELARQQAEVAQRRAEQANRAKDIFLATMSHELRTPLNSILGYAQILKRDLSLVTHHGKLSIIEESGHHLLILINDILDFAQIETGKITLNKKPVPLRSMVANLYEFMRLSAEAKEIQFQLEIDEVSSLEMIEVDEHRLRQVLINLLDNAIKFTDRGVVRFQVQPVLVLPKLVALNEHLREDLPTKSIRFLVQDTGPGIPSADQEVIFTMFGQGKGQNGQRPGRGLGLTIAQRLLHLMDSQLHVESTVDVGSTFWFDLTSPLDERVYQTKEENRQIVGIKGERPTILIIDDNDLNRALFVEMLTSIGVDVIEVSTGAQGIALAKDRRPDLIIVDVVMLRMDGIEVISQIRHTPELSDIMLIATSANVFPDIQERSFAAGCDAFLPKPIDFERLFEQLSLLNIDWIYKEQPRATRDSANQGTMVLLSDIQMSDRQMMPPLDDIELLFQSAQIGDIEEIQGQIDRLRRASSAFHRFLDPLQQLVDTFQMNKLQQYLQKSLRCFIK